jgi:L-asparagine transporter-like permease
LMSHKGLAHAGLQATHKRHETPGRAIVLSAVATGLPVAILAWRGAAGLDVYGWLGSIATYGFIVAYGLVSVSLPGYLKQHGANSNSARILSALAFIAMVLALAGNLYPVPEGPYGKFPYIFVAYIVAGLVWYFYRSRKGKTF